MGGSGFASAWSLTEQPDRIEVVIALVFALNLVTIASTGVHVSWYWFIIGFFVWMAVVEPISATSPGQAVDGWIQGIGVAGRLVGSL